MESWDWLDDRVAAVAAKKSARIDYEQGSVLLILACLASGTKRIPLTAEQQFRGGDLPPEIAVTLARADGQTLMAIILEAMALLGHCDLG